MAHHVQLFKSVIAVEANMEILKGLGSGEAIDFEDMWGILSSSLREIHTKNASKLSFEELYRNAYKLVLKKKGEPLYLKVKEFEEDWLTNETYPRILKDLSPSLFISYTKASASAMAAEKRVAGEMLLRSLKQAWEDHNLCMNMTTDVLMYMVRLGDLKQYFVKLGAWLISRGLLRTVSTVRTASNHQYLLLLWGNFGILY